MIFSTRICFQLFSRHFNYFQSSLFWRSMKKEKVNFLQVCFAIAGRYSEFKITFQLFCYGTYVQDISMFKIIQSFNEKGETTVLHQQSESLKNISEFYSIITAIQISVRKTTFYDKSSFLKIIGDAFSYFWHI